MKQVVEQKLEEILKARAELEVSLADPEAAARTGDYAKKAKEFARLSRTAELFATFKTIRQELEKTREMLAKQDQDPEFLELAKEEEAALSKDSEAREAELENLLLESDEDPDRKVMVEIRAGTGGEEASLFAGDLLRMYTYYAQSKGLKIETLSTSVTGLGGIKEVIFSVSGDRTWAYFKFESGTHRVQRVPKTEASGRIHTSAVTVAVLPEADEVEVNLDPKDLRVDVYRSSGPGGQGVNTTDSAVRITHIPSGIVVQCQNERSQLQNKQTAMKVLRARLHEIKRKEQEDRMSSEYGEKQKIEWGSQIRSYVMHPYSMVKDHRTNVEVGDVQRVMNGDITVFIEAFLRWKPNKK